MSVSCVVSKPGVRPRPASDRVNAARNSKHRGYKRKTQQTLFEWKPVLSALPLSEKDAESAANRAENNRTSLPRELVAMGLVSETDLFRAIADELCLPFIESIEPSRLTLREPDRLLALSQHSGLPAVFLAQPDGSNAVLVATPDIDLAQLKAQIARRPELGHRLCIAAPGELRAAILARTRQRLLFDAQYDLFARSPELCARFVANGWQGVCIGIILTALPIAILMKPGETLLALQIVAAIAFCACICLRVMALGRARPIRLSRLPSVDPAELPVYSVLVTLYREREVVPQLLLALGQLQWPRSKLEIKLICEADDKETLAALRSSPLRPCVEIIEVPQGAPRTKPRALCYALPLCTGEFITLYDAEDRPHPLQLLEAWVRFNSEGEDLACLQAPLVIDNARSGFLARMFAFEYAGLFRGILPWLAHHNLVMPLGGTSNHFRRSALAKVGGWDAYNVTEDADLGLRLARSGYRAGTITRQTLEEAPETLSAWLPQRVRWNKGYLQTWLVHMRDPRATWRELGPGSFIAMQLLFPGMLVSALIHPIFLGSVLYALGSLAYESGGVSAGVMAMATVGFVNIALGYGAFIAIGAVTLTLSEKRSLLSIVLSTPIYWLLLSLAAWMALWEFYRHPHHWNKTPHKMAKGFVGGKGSAHPAA